MRLDALVKLHDVFHVKLIAQRNLEQAHVRHPCLPEGLRLGLSAQLRGEKRHAADSQAQGESNFPLTAQRRPKWMGHTCGCRR